MYFDRQVFINGVLSAIGFVFVFVCIVCICITVDHVIKKCRNRRRREAEELAMYSFGYLNDEPSCQSRINNNGLPETIV